MDPGRMVLASLRRGQNSGPEPAESNDPPARDLLSPLDPPPPLCLIHAVPKLPWPPRTLLLALLLASTTAPGQIPGLKSPPKQAPVATPAADLAYDSPRASLIEFEALCRAGRLADAARYLELPEETPPAEGQRLARRLKAILDFNIPDPAKVSSSSGGRLDDGLPPDIEEIGVVFTSSADRAEQIKMVRREWRGRFVWVFTRGTVSRIDRWYDSLPDHALRERLPAEFFLPGPSGILWWQWIALLLVLPVVVVLGHVFGWGTRRVLLKLAQQTKTQWDEIFVRRLKGPIALGWGILLLFLSLYFLKLNAAGFDLIVRVLQTAAAIWFFWILVKAVRLGSDVAAVSDWARTNPNAPSILTFGVRAGEFLVVALGVLVSLSAFGVNVASVLAGLGIGGIAIALAGQKTVENLFGSVSIAVDQPLKVGDWVKIGDIQGSVELIGLRSTRIRTPDRTVVTIPNGKLADREIETFAPRDRFRLAVTIGLDYGTKAAAMRQILAGFEKVLRDNPRIWPDDVRVALAAFGDSALMVEVTAWFETQELGEFRAIRQEVLLAFLDVVEAAGSSIAFPSRTLYMRAPENPATLPAP